MINKKDIEKKKQKEKVRKYLGESVAKIIDKEEKDKS